MGIPISLSLSLWLLLTVFQAQKFGSFADDDDDELDEESLLETPLDKVEPYGLFKHVLLSMCVLSSCRLAETDLF